MVAHCAFGIGTALAAPLNTCEANAALIVKAVNQHHAFEPMREALRDALEEIGKRRPDPEVIKRGEAALKLAGDAT